MLTLIIKYAVNVPITDQYELIPIFQHIDDGQIMFNDFWKQHNEHRILFPNIILVVLAKLTNWNILSEIYLSFTIACIGFLGLLSLTKRHIKDNKLQAVTAFLVSAFYFTPAQWENWVWGWQLEWFLCTTCIIWSLNLLDRIEPKETLNKIIPPIALATVATFSLGSGALVWFAGVVVLFSKRIKKSFWIAWLSVMLTSFILYYSNYHKPNNGLSNTSFLQDIPAFVKFYLAYIGRPISDKTEVAVFMGLYIALLYFLMLAYMLHRKITHKIIGAVSLGIVAFGAGMLTTIARFDNGMSGPMSSRYTTFSALITISLIISVGIIISISRIKPKSMNVITTLLLVIFLPSIFYSWHNGLRGMRMRSRYYNYIYQCSHEHSPTQECLYEIYFPSTKIAQERLEYLKLNNLAGYR